MVRLTIDGNLETKLLQGNEPLELCDAGGRVIGHFIPVATAARYAGLVSPTPARELDRRSREQPGCLLEDILDDLQDRS